jgi:hypothetical protein
MRLSQENFVEGSRAQCPVNSLQCPGWQDSTGPGVGVKREARSLGKTPPRSVAFRCCGLHLAFVELWKDSTT